MPEVSLDQQLPLHSVVARNFATDSENRIHSDEVATDYGYRGGLVPGVAVYAYMTVPVVEALGVEWARRGTMRAKFIKPVYDGERTDVSARVVAVNPVRITISVVNAEDVLCAVGEASLPEGHPELDAARYAFLPLPEPGRKRPATIASLADDTELGSLEFTGRAEETEDDSVDFLDELCDPLPLYRGPDAVTHPALFVHMANSILSENVDLGPWIHSASDVNYYDLPGPGEKLSIRGRVGHSYAKRGHEIVVLDLAVLGDEKRPVAHLTHTAIVRPQKQQA